MPRHNRFALLTHNLELLADARKLALAAGHTVDLYPPDGPVPEAGAFTGVIADLEGIGRQPLARKLFLTKLAAVAKVFPVVALDRGLNYQDAKVLRAAGVKWLPTLRAKAFEVLLAKVAVPAVDEADAVAVAGAE